VFQCLRLSGSDKAVILSTYRNGIHPTLRGDRFGFALKLAELVEQIASGQRLPAPDIADLLAID
jgi:hypothetical protein